MMHPLQKPAGWKPKIAVIGVGGGGGNAVDNMITQELSGVDFLVANTDAQALVKSKASQVVQLGLKVTEGRPGGIRLPPCAAGGHDCERPPAC